MRKQPSRQVAKRDDLDLTPPEEIHARRIRRVVLLGALLACVLGVAIYFAASPVGGAIKAWQSRRIAREAFALIERRKWSEANAKARDAYLLRPTEPESWRAIARLASRTNQWPAALGWWKKVDDADHLSVEDRRDYIAAAVVTGEVTLAAKQVQLLMAKGTPAPIDLVWAGQLASRQSDSVLALDYGERALADKRAKPYETMAAASLVLSLANPYSQPYASAWKQIEDIGRDPKNPASLDALAVLANEQALPPPRAIGGNPSVSLKGTPAASQTPATQGTAAPGPIADHTEVSPNIVRAAGEGGTPSQEPLSGQTSQITPTPPNADTLSLSLGVTLPPAPTAATISEMSRASSRLSARKCGTSP